MLWEKTDKLIEDYLVDEAIEEGKQLVREAREMAISYLEADLKSDPEALDNAILRHRIERLKRQLGIRTTKEEVRAQTRERVRRHRERKRAQV